MSKIIAKNVEHDWSPRTPNRAEPLEFDRFHIHIAGNHTKIDLFSFDKQNNEICHSIQGDIEKAYPEALKYIPGHRSLDFEKDFSAASINNVIKINKAKGWLPKDSKEVPRKKQSIRREFDTEIKNLELMNFMTPGQLLSQRVKASGLELGEIAEKVGLHYSMVQKQMTGERDITRDHALRYSRLFGCDPANILFPSPQIPVWANVDFLNVKNDDLPFNAGECIPRKERFNVTVSREQYRPDLKAIKVKSEGSIYDGMILLYYATSDVKQDCVNRLCIIGDNEDGDIELMRYGESQRYFIGIFEHHRGKTRLLNPDPFAKEALKDTAQGGELVLNNVRPTFAAPIIAIIDPNKNNKNKYSEKLLQINDQAYKGQRMLEEAKLKFAEMMTAEMNKMTAKQKELQKELEKLYVQMESEQKKGRAFFFGRRSGIPSLLDQMNTNKLEMQKQLFETELAAAKLQAELRAKKVNEK